MSTYFMLGKYSSEAVKGISAGRTQKAQELIKKLGGKIQSMHVLLGCYDLVLIVDLPDLGSALKASIELSKLTGIGFNTAPAVSVAEFDKIIGA